MCIIWQSKNGCLLSNKFDHNPDYNRVKIVMIILNGMNLGNGHLLQTSVIELGKQWISYSF